MGYSIYESKIIIPIGVGARRLKKSDAKLENRWHVRGARAEGGREL
jgi:hypothetical protein